MSQNSLHDLLTYGNLLLIITCYLQTFSKINRLRKLIFSFYLNKGRVTACNLSKHITVNLVIVM